jgi:hypothetical protein
MNGDGISAARARFDRAQQHACRTIRRLSEARQRLGLHFLLVKDLEDLDTQDSTNFKLSNVPHMFSTLIEASSTGKRHRQTYTTRSTEPAAKSEVDVDCVINTLQACCDLS